MPIYNYDITGELVTVENSSKTELVNARSILASDGKTPCFEVSVNKLKKDDFGKLVTVSEYKVSFEREYMNTTLARFAIAGKGKQGYAFTTLAAKACIALNTKLTDADADILNADIEKAYKVWQNEFHKPLMVNRIENKQKYQELQALMVGADGSMRANWKTHVPALIQELETTVRENKSLASENTDLVSKIAKLEADLKAATKKTTKTTKTTK